MPWMVRQETGSGRHCVYKRDADGKPMGDSLGCHGSEAEAQAQMRALHANMPNEHKAVKLAEGTDDVIEGPGMPFGGPFNGRDLDQQYFSKTTDFALDWFAPNARPLLYHHGLDDDAGTTVVGRVKSWEVKADIGVWTQAQLDKQSKYFAAIKEMVAAGKLYLSSGAMAHLVQVEQKTGEIKRWPWVELSLTPTPANLLARVDLAVAEKHFKAAGLELPEAVKLEPTADIEAKATDTDALSIVDHAILTANYATTLAQRTKDLSQRRVKEGRVISSMNRKRIRECMDAMDGAMVALRDLYDSTEPQPAKAASVRRLRAQLVAQQINALALS